MNILKSQVKAQLKTVNSLKKLLIPRTIPVNRVLVFFFFFYFKVAYSKKA